ncbi:MAG: FKBP-type peptidyl-prolyl cis-trans isomerase [Kistimonas sp.]|nr:FKBP-type peptidyl-prolyl cis-trans isomerase [Kistimonas sp.]
MSVGDGGIVPEQGARVRLHFALKLNSGELVDSTFDGDPVSLVIGDGTLPDGFERCLLSMEAGTRRIFQLSPEQAFGAHRAENVHRLQRRRFSTGMALETGLVVGFASPGGGELPGVVCALDEQYVTIDFNHPLAGQSLEFEVALESVSAAESVKDGLVDGVGLAPVAGRASG